jgi:hypothetical protein
MNIFDFPSTFTEKDIPRMFEYIFLRQHQLAEKYTPIEDKNGLRWTTEYPVAIDSGKGQAQLKDMAWRALEEVAESMESLFITKDSEDHSKEELADGLHFITELLLLAGITYKDVELRSLNINLYKKVAKNAETQSFAFWLLVRLGIAMNNLKMKPWKQTPMKTDVNKLKEDLLEAYESYILLMLNLMSPVEILNYYFSKSEVNNFRIRSNY